MEFVSCDPLLVHPYLWVEDMDSDIVFDAGDAPT